MRRWLALVWLLIPVGLVAYHYDKGARRIQEEKAYAFLTETQRLARQPDADWEAIIARYDMLATMLPRDEKPRVFREIRLAKAKARLECLSLAKAIEELDVLLPEVADAYGDDARITRGTREAMGKAQYLAAWALKSTLAPEKEWLPYAERARQSFRYLAEHYDPAAYEAYRRRVDRIVNRMEAKR
ncbi:MAG: hypothetical protein WCR06_00745 [bacterium]